MKTAWQVVGFVLGAWMVGIILGILTSVTVKFLIKLGVF